MGCQRQSRTSVQVIRDGRVDYLADGMGAPNDLVFGPDGRQLALAERCSVIRQRAVAVRLAAHCFGGDRVDELYVSASFQQSLLRIRLQSAMT
jgi:hypothetical protein